MKKTYIAPSVDIEYTEISQIIATSIGAGEGLSGGDADVKEEGSTTMWDIWSDGDANADQK